MISVAVTSSPSKSFLLPPALVQSAVIPRGMGSTHTVTAQRQCNLTALDGRPPPCHNLSRGTHSEDFLPSGLFPSSSRVPQLQQAWSHSIPLGVST